jgi:molybdopterin-guanine dinucleotide biosynthesis protein A
VNDIAPASPAGVEARPAPRLELMETVGEPVTGIVLAGGQSMRMGHDKAWVELAGRPLALWVLDALRAVSDHQIIVAREPGRLETLGVRVVPDRFRKRGPLTAIHAGLKAAKSELCLVVACDMPLVRPALLAHLAAAVGPLHAAVPYIGEGQLPKDVPGGTLVTARDAGPQPMLAAYRRSCIVPIEKLLMGGAVPTTAVLSVLKVRIVAPDEWRGYDPDGRSFFNVNTYEDLIEAARIVAGPESEGDVGAV